MYKIILFFCLVVVALAQYHHEEKEHIVDYYAQPKYKFDYSVHDPHTHDEKKVEEHREGKLTEGSYRFKEADGKNERHVHYVIESHLREKHY